jgi:hypothetical protein
VGPRAGPDEIGKTETSFPCRESNPDVSHAIPLTFPEVVVFILVNVYALTTIPIITYSTEVLGSFIAFMPSSPQLGVE